MSDVNVVFSRAILRDVHARVKAAFPKLNLHKSCGVISYGNDLYEFEVVANGEPRQVFTVTASNGYEARANGWTAYLRAKGIEA